MGSGGLEQMLKRLRHGCGALLDCSSDDAGEGSECVSSAVVLGAMRDFARDHCGA